jgi:hypothetical protein
MVNRIERDIVEVGEVSQPAPLLLARLRRLCP